MKRVTNIKIRTYKDYFATNSPQIDPMLKNKFKVRIQNVKNIHPVQDGNSMLQNHSHLI